MTSKSYTVKKSNNESLIKTLLCVLLVTFTLLLSGEVKKGIYEGLLFSFSTIIPTLFPFFIISDLWNEYFAVNEKSLISKIFKSILGIPSCALGAYISGLICGFPIGAKSAADLYNKNKISLSDLTLISAISNNPSVAFVISGIGMGIFGNIRVGIIMYLSVVFSSLTVCAIFSKRKIEYNYSEEIMRQTFSFPDSVRNAGLSSINVSSFIILFSGVIRALKSFIKSTTVFPIFCSFLEVSNAAREIGGCSEISKLFRFSLIAFSLGFSGLSVFFQSTSFFPNSMSKSKYLLYKLFQGLLCAAYSTVFFLSIKCK